LFEIVTDYFLKNSQNQNDIFNLVVGLVSGCTDFRVKNGGIWGLFSHYFEASV
jgi:hypothetical protein